MKKMLVTGAAGFIGFHTTKRLLASGKEVVGIDNFNTYYDVKLKEARTRLLEGTPNFRMLRMDISDTPEMKELFRAEKFDGVIHLAAQAGVRYSLQNPHAYVDSNVKGTLNVLEGCRYAQVRHLVFASSSSVYGLNTSMPFSVHNNVDHPVSLYAATKKASELMAHTYSHLFGIPTTGLRFFTVYGPWGRPDMALFLFTKSILEGRPIDVFNHGKMKRDFTYVGDIVEGIVRILEKPPTANLAWDSARPDPASSTAPYRLYNIGNSDPVELTDFIAAIEDALGRKAIRNSLPLQAGDVPETYADVSDLEREIGFKPTTSVREGVGKFIEWYRSYYRV